MGTRRALMTVLVIGLCIGLQSTWAKAFTPETAVCDDGTEMVAVVPRSETAAVRSDPYEGTGKRSQEALFAEGVSLEQPDLAAIRALKPMTSGVGVESVIGSDTRIRTYSTYGAERKVVLITNTTDGFKCSGFLIGNNTVVTAGHCVHSGGSTGRWHTRTGYRIYPGANGTSFPFGSCTAKSLHSVGGWTKSANEQYDYGAIKMNCTVGNTTGWFGYFWQQASLTNHPSIVPGYPGDKTGRLANTQWWSSDKIRYTTTQQVFYANDTYGGMSGCPVWEDRNGTYAMAIHGYGLHGSPPHSLYNHGKRITQVAFNNLRYWKNLP